MGIVNKSLADSLKSLIDEQVTQRGYVNSSDYMRESIGQDADRLDLRGLLLEAERSPSAGPADATYFAALRQRIQKRAPC